MAYASPATDYAEGRVTPNVACKWKDSPAQFLVHATEASWRAGIKKDAVLVVNKARKPVDGSLKVARPRATANPHGLKERAFLAALRLAFEIGNHPTVIKGLLNSSILRCTLRRQGGVCLLLEVYPVKKDTKTPPKTLRQDLYQ